MTGFSTLELAEAREATRALLDTLGLASYLFEVEPRTDGRWEVRIDCAVADGWQSVVLPVSRERLLASRSDQQARAELLHDWGARLAACTTR